VEFGAGRVLAGLVKKMGPDLHTSNVDTVDNLTATMTHLSDLE
jgi:hypothetical protein